MNKQKINKRKILNDPVHGFINIPSDIIFDLIEHKYFQRLKRITQLGLTHFVYPGAIHTRFLHAIGAMHLMNLAIEVIRAKGHEISEAEAKSVTIAILLHDIGHGPFSHTLEKVLINDVSHEDISIAFIKKLNIEFDNKLDLALKIFQNKYKKRFLHQLVASQLDMDRLDYLKRDSFFTGVSEGVIGSDRIIKMLDVVDDNLVVEAKGIYSIEKFLVARRLMYWQVYLHKTVLAAEELLIKILKRAKELANKNVELFASPSLHYFLYNYINKKDFLNNVEVLEKFADLDDYDIISALKVWSKHQDKVLSMLCLRLINRKLFKVELQDKAFESNYIESIKEKYKKQYGLNNNEIDYFVFSNTISNNAYKAEDDKINILYNSGKLVDITDASDVLNVSVLSKEVKKYFLIYPKT